MFNTGHQTGDRGSLIGQTAMGQSDITTLNLLGPIADIYIRHGVSIILWEFILGDIHKIPLPWYQAVYSGHFISLREAALVQLQCSCH